MPESGDYETTFLDFWEPIVCPGGVWNYDQIKRELHDYRMAMGEAAKVYDHITGGRISKINTLAYEVIGQHDDLWHWGEDCGEERATLDALTAVLTNVAEHECIGLILGKPRCEPAGPTKCIVHKAREVLSEISHKWAEQ